MNKKLLIYIVVPVIILVIVVAIVMLSGKENDINNEVGNANNEIQTNEIEKNQESTKEDEEKEWGVTEGCAAQNNSKTYSYLINFPKYTGVSVGWAKVAEQSLDEVVLTCGQNDDSPAIHTLADFFPAYFTELQETLEDFYGSRSSNYEFALKGAGKPVTIGDYEMYVFEGTIDFDHTNGHRHHQFVAYATTLKSNGAYAYWMAYDTSDDQSFGNLIKEHAYNMAKTFREDN